MHKSSVELTNTDKTITSLKNKWYQGFQDWLLLLLFSIGNSRAGLAEFTLPQISTADPTPTLPPSHMVVITLGASPDGPPSETLRHVLGWCLQPKPLSRLEKQRPIRALCHFCKETIIPSYCRSSSLPYTKPTLDTSCLEGLLTMVDGSPSLPWVSS